MQAALNCFELFYGEFLRKIFIEKVFMRIFLHWNFINGNVDGNAKIWYRENSYGVIKKFQVKSYVL